MGCSRVDLAPIGRCQEPSLAKFSNVPEANVSQNKAMSLTVRAPTVLVENTSKPPLPLSAGGRRTFCELLFTLETIPGSMLNRVADNTIRYPRLHAFSIERSFRLHTARKELKGPVKIRQQPDQPVVIRIGLLTYVLVLIDKWPRY